MARKKSITIPKRRLIFGIGLALGFLLTSCTAVRTITTSAETKQDGENHVQIQTKTVESYVGSKQK